MKYLVTAILIVLASIAIHFIIKSINKYWSREPKSGKGSEKWEVASLEFISGLIEVVMYVVSLTAGTPEFIVFWIGVKTALLWVRKVKPNYIDEVYHYIPNSGLVKRNNNEDIESTIEKQNHETKIAYLRFLIGNALNMIVSFGIAWYFLRNNPLI